MQDRIHAICNISTYQTSGVEIRSCILINNKNNSNVKTNIKKNENTEPGSHSKGLPEMHGTDLTYGAQVCPMVGYSVCALIDGAYIALCSLQAYLSNNLTS